MINVSTSGKNSATITMSTAELKVVRRVMSLATATNIGTADAAVSLEIAKQAKTALFEAWLRENPELKET